MRHALGILGELGEVLEGQSSGASVFSGDDQRRDLNDLAFTAWGGAGLTLGLREVLESVGLFSVVGCLDSEQGDVDGVHEGRFRRSAEQVLTRC